MRYNRVSRYRDKVRLKRAFPETISLCVFTFFKRVLFDCRRAIVRVLIERNDGAFRDEEVRLFRKTQILYNRSRAD